jgi:hypothetical protein
MQKSLIVLSTVTLLAGAAITGPIIARDRSDRAPIDQN